LGNPFGLGGSVSRGILSSGPRRAATDDEPLKLPDWLQTDAAINPGNSGGPLINLRGELIGINNAVFTRGQGIGFAIPVKRVAEAISEIITPETTNKRLWFGARFHPGALPLRVAEVQPGSPAEKAGLRAGDDLVSYNERPAKSFFRTTIELTEAGGVGEIALVIRRGAELKKLTARMVPEKEFFNAEIISKKLGVTLQELTPALADSLGFTPKAGLLVASIEQDSPAAGAGLQAKMLVRGVDGFATTDIVDAAKLLFAKKRGDRVKLDVLIQRQRNGFTYTTQHAVELPVR
ncbi:MAG: PDZ domain-containing protein, partial [Verrucomicrobia bacterium]|nr:PDZ domain-containing protein [Verrucomicrobiota bacterium]